MRTHLLYWMVIAALVAVILMRGPRAPENSDPLALKPASPASQPVDVPPSRPVEEFFGVWSSSKEEPSLVLEADGVWGWKDPAFEQVIKMKTGWFVHDELLIILGGETHPHLPQNLAMTFSIRTTPDGTTIISAEDFGEMTRVGTAEVR